jgi:putative ABC transport system substrate-binding protein
MPHLVNARRILLIGFVALVQALPALAQTESDRLKVSRVGMLSDSESFGNPISPQDWLGAFRAGLRDAGYHEGENIQFEYRNADRDPQKLAQQAAELAALKLSVIVASSTTAAKAAKAATQTIPIVFWGAEPISSGLVQNLDHPGENLTGVTENEEQQKEFLAQLKEIVPGLDRVAILFNLSYAPVPGLLKYAEEGARTLGLSPQLVKVTTSEDLAGAFAEMKRESCRASLVLNHGLFFREREKLAALAIENRIALSTPYLRNAEAGVLIAHEADFDRVWRMNASYVAKILKGAKPGDLPVQRVPAIQYWINVKTAEALGLTIPASILKQAAMVIPDSSNRPAQRSLPAAAPRIEKDPSQSVQRDIESRARVRSPEPASVYLMDEPIHAHLFLQLH